MTPLQQHRLADHHDAGIDKAGAGCARIRRQFARVVGVKRHIGGLAARLEGGDEVLAHPLRLDDRHAGVEADDLHVLDAGKPLRDLREAARREHQRIAAGEDDLPDLRMGRDIGEGLVHGLRRERAETLRPHHLAAEAEAAIDRADMHRLEQHPVRVAMHDALDGAMCKVADRIAALLGRDGRVRPHPARIAGRSGSAGSSRSIRAAMAGVIATA